MTQDFWIFFSVQNQPQTECRCVVILPQGHLLTQVAAMTHI